MKINILNAEPHGYNPEAREVLKKVGTLHEEHCDRGRLLELIPDFDVLIVRLGNMIDSEIINKGSKLKVIITATTGLNHIDLDSASARGVEVLSLKGEREFLDTITATAELTWCLVLSLVRRLPSAHGHVLGGNWNRNLFVGNELRNKTLGVIGFGRLGSIVAEYGRVFRMNVMACDTQRDDVPDWVQKVTLDNLLVKSDVVSLHVNLEESTRAFFKRKEIFAMKKGALLINTSRGELVDEQALCEALESGHLGGAALDVLKGEVSGESGWLMKNHLWNYARSHDNLILTPHIGGATIESMADTELFMANKLSNFICQYKSEFKEL